MVKPTEFTKHQSLIPITIVKAVAEKSYTGITIRILLVTGRFLEVVIYLTPEEQI